MTKEIRLPTGQIAFVSDEDWPLVSKMKWSLKNSAGYVRACYKKSVGGDGSLVSLHRFIMRPPPGMVVDHIDGNPLNNTRENLQITTQSRNAMRRKNVLSGGVNKVGHRWRVRISVDGQQKSFGTYDTQDEAARVLAAARAEAWSDTINWLGTAV